MNRDAWWWWYDDNNDDVLGARHDDIYVFPVYAPTNSTDASA